MFYRLISVWLLLILRFSLIITGFRIWFGQNVLDLNSIENFYPLKSS